jgi:hypothetical protein
MCPNFLPIYEYPKSIPSGLSIHRSRRKSLHQPKAISRADASVHSGSFGYGYCERHSRNYAWFGITVSGDALNFGLGFDIAADCGLPCQCVHGRLEPISESTSLVAVGAAATAGSTDLVGVSVHVANGVLLYS